jgi:glycerol-3-phosphate dehydrogenase (NAD+)
LLGDNIRAVPEVQDASRGADMLVIVAPHQFLEGICGQLAGVVSDTAVAISLIKGMTITPEGPKLPSALIQKLVGIDCSVLMGANIAADIAKEEFSEATIGCRCAANGELFVKLFDTDYFHCTAVEDVEGAEICGTLKNIVACVTPSPPPRTTPLPCVNKSPTSDTIALTWRPRGGLPTCVSSRARTCNFES